MNMLWVNLVVWAGLAFAAVPVLYVLVTTLGALVPRREPPPSPRPCKIAVLIPAHNEALLISDTVRSVFAQTYARSNYAVWVIADNCSDDTASLARAAGAHVLERSGNPGKGQGLNDALRALMQEDWAAFVVLDADSEFHPRSLEMLDRQLADGAEVVQIRIAVQNPSDSMVTRAMELSQASYNALRPRGRTALGLSAGINGNGFCMTREVVTRVPYLAHSIVEDIEYHMLLLKAGIRVRFLDSVWVKAQIPIGGRGARVQRVRWERGRIITIRNYAPSLLRDLFHGDRFAVDALVDVLMPPVSLVVLAFMPAIVLGARTAQLLGVLGLSVLCMHYVVAAVRYGNIRFLGILAVYMPWYIVSKTYLVIASMFTERKLAWERTDRHKPRAEKKP